MRTDVLIEMVSSIFNDVLCEGCEILSDAGEKEYTDVYGSCLGCREAAAQEIIGRLRQTESAVYCKDCRDYVDHRCRRVRSLADWRQDYDFCSYGVKR